MRGEGKSKKAGVTGGKYGKKGTGGDEVVETQPGSWSDRGLGTGVGFVLGLKGNRMEGLQARERQNHTCIWNGLLWQWLLINCLMPRFPEFNHANSKRGHWSIRRTGATQHAGRLQPFWLLRGAGLEPSNRVATFKTANPLLQKSIPCVCWI